MPVRGPMLMSIRNRPGVLLLATRADGPDLAWRQWVCTDRVFGLDPPRCRRKAAQRGHRERTPEPRARPVPDWRGWLIQSQLARKGGLE
jgi:hypothetical protein